MNVVNPIILRGQDISDTTATQSDVLAGKDFYLANGQKVSGTIPTYSGSTTVTQNGSLLTAGTYVENDITVTVEAYYLIYSFGSQGTGSLPSPVAATEGEVVAVDFTVVPSCIDNRKDFIGWSTTDGSTVPTYAPGTGASITMNSNVILYPVFKTVVRINIDNLCSSGIEVCYIDDQDQIIDTNTIQAGSTLIYDTYATIRFKLRSLITDNINFDSIRVRGTYLGTDYTSYTSFYNYVDGGDGYIYFESPSNSVVWVADDTYTLTVTFVAVSS